MLKNTELDELDNTKKDLFELRHLAWQEQDDAWKRLQSLRLELGPRISYTDQEQNQLCELTRNNLLKKIKLAGYEWIQAADKFRDANKEARAKLEVDSRNITGNIYTTMSCS